VGILYVDADVSTGTARTQHVRFLVDSGSTYSVLPPRVWRALRLEPKRALDFVLADGTTLRRQVSECRFALEGVDGWSPVILGQRRDTALLGTVTLETLGLVLNPFDRTLKPMRMLMMAAAPA